MCSPELGVLPWELLSIMQCLKSPDRSWGHATPVSTSLIYSTNGYEHVTQLEAPC